MSTPSSPSGASRDDDKEIQGSFQEFPSNFGGSGAHGFDQYNPADDMNLRSSCWWNDADLLGDEGRPAVVMMRKKSRLNSARSRPGEESKAAMVQKNSKMVLECPVLPCWDETDDGVPGCCRSDDPKWWMFFNPKNQFTNDNILCISFGNVGFHWFDERRSTWIGIAMWSTLFSIAFTIAGCFAFSTNSSIVKDVHWFRVHATNLTTSEEYVLYLGLRSVVYVHNPCTPFGCSESSYLYAEEESWWVNDFVNNGLGDCRDVASQAAFGAIMTCVTLLFALSGTITRMKFSSDANIQKALGMITDLFCASVPQTITLVTVGSKCWSDIDRHYKGQILAKVWFGPGYLCYVVCLLAAFMRAIFHWLTPIPGGGSGCTPQLPQALIDLLDEDGDGVVTWAEVKKAYPRFVKRRKEARIAQKEYLQQARESAWNLSKKNGALMVKMNKVESKNRTARGSVEALQWQAHAVRNSVVKEQPLSQAGQSSGGPGTALDSIELSDSHLGASYGPGVLSEPVELFDGTVASASEPPVEV